MNKFLQKLDRILSVISIIMVGLIASGVIISVFLRYFFSLSYGWVEEFLTMLFVAITFMCSALCIREKQHINISYFTDKYDGVMKTISDIFIQVCMIAVSVFLLIFSSKWIYAVGSTISPNSGIPFGYFYSIVPISAILSIFYSCIDILSHFIHIEDAKTGYFDDDAIPEEIVI